jgi:hypothetical protein
MFEGTIDGVDGEDGVVTDVGMVAFQAGAAYGDQRLDQHPSNFLKDAKCHALD